MKTKIYYIALSLIAGVIVATSYSVGLFSGLENFFEDLMLSSKPVDGRLVIAAIDDESISRIGQWPWSRSVFADVFNKLNQNPPLVVGFDAMLSEQSRLGAGDDITLASALSRLRYPVVFPVEKMRSADITPLEIFIGQPTVKLGHVNLILDVDGVIRRFQPEGSFAYRAADLAGEVPLALKLGEDERVVYAGQTGSIRRVPFWRLLEPDAPNLKDKIVFIGATAADLHDEQLTPFSRGQAMPGVEIQANITNMLIQGYRLHPLNFGWMALWIFAAALFPAIILLVIKKVVWEAALIISAVFAQTIAVIIFFSNGLVVNFIHINLALILSAVAIFVYRYISGEKEKREIKKIFSKYVSSEVLDGILADASKVKLGGEEKEVTVFFSDIRGFTTLSERTTPKELVGVLNQYFSAMAEKVFQHKGYLDKYIGDAIMAFWGAPVGDTNQADNALRASLEMVEALKKLNKLLSESGKPEINIGIGLYTGPAIVGNVGSNDRLSYTVIGDTVNVASRLEGLNKEYKTNIIIGESTKNKLKGRYNLKQLGAVKVKGREEAVNIYSVSPPLL